MLEKVRQLRDSMKEDQREEIKEVVGEEIYSLLSSLFGSTTEPQAQERLEALTTVVKEDPVKAFAFYERLTAEQKDLVEELVDI